jgi:transcriptional regulator with XRE-family HTH domain
MDGPIVLSGRRKRSIGRRIRLAREGAGLTRLQLARRCRITTSQIANYETGFCTPSFAVALKLVDMFGADSFMRGGVTGKCRKSQRRIA